MKRKIEKAIALFLCLVMLSSVVLTSCNDGNNTTDDTSEKQTNSTEHSETTESEKTTDDGGTTESSKTTEPNENTESGQTTENSESTSESEPHEHNYTAVVTAPTCTVKGCTTYICDCGESYTADEIAALGHDYSDELAYNSTHHYYECYCGSRKDEAAHVSSGAPTAVKDEVCTACGYVINHAVGIKFNTLSVSGNKVYGKVSNDTEYYSFINEIIAVGGAKYVVSTDISGINAIPSKTIPLTVGDNTVHITEYINDIPIAIYQVVIRRRPIYEVSFDTKGGTVVESITVEEDSFITAPQTSRAGYTFVSWDYDFNAPITSNTTINALWSANTDTTYKVEYYLQNVEKNGYDLVETLNLAGETNTTANAEQKTFEHFALNTSKSTLSGNINGDGSLALKVYYTRNTFSVTSYNTSIGTVSGGGSHVYNKQITVSAIPNIGSVFLGWYSGDQLLSTESEYTCNIDKNIVAKFDAVEEMQNFNFTSTESTCSITGIKDKTVTEIIVPDYVTSISKGAFAGCSSLENITLPFVGGSSKTSSDAYQYPLGYIFGDSSYAGGTKTQQSYISSSANIIQTSLFYIPTSLKNVTITSGNILHGAFKNCSSLTSITIPNSVISIDDDAFKGCSSLMSIVIPNSVTNIGSEAFYGCSSLTSITIPNSVTSIGYQAFYKCSSITSITFVDTSSWYRTTSSSMTGGTSTSVINASSNATYFKSTYYYYYWYKE